MTTPTPAPERRPRIADREVLRRTSRSFALSMELLPGPLRAPIETAYLLARIGDTLADQGLAPAEVRIEGLERLRTAIGGDGRLPGGIPPEPAGGGGSDRDQVTARAEAVLLAGTGRVLERLAALPDPDGAEVRRVVDRLLSTMVGELQAFGLRGPDAAGLTALPDAAALSAYTEGIAGCVGEFWTRLLLRHAHRFAKALPARRAAVLTIEGRRYGRGLQLVNVLRDVPRDLRRGRCFLPADELRALGLAPMDLLDPAAGPRVAPLFARWEARARRGLLSGIAYARSLTGAGVRVRMATLLPARLGLATLRVLESAGPRERLDPGTVLRVPRAEVRRIAFATLAQSLRAGSRSR